MDSLVETPWGEDSDEDVVEFTLTESKDGLESTSIIVGEGLFRIVETKMHQDGVPRIDLKLALDSELTGFQHIVEKPTVMEMGSSVGLFTIGLILCIFPYQFTMIFGISAILLGIKLAPIHLEKHRLVFSSCGSTHLFDIDLSGVFKPTFRASMALIGPTLAEYMKTGEIDSSSIDDLHAALRAPIPAFEPMQIEAPLQIANQIPVGPPVIQEIANEPLPPMTETTNQDIESPDETISDGQENEELSQPVQVVSIPAPPQIVPQPNPLPPPPQIVPQPKPLPPPPAMLPNQPPLPGFDSASLPLDAPLPEAPRIPVAAAPQQQTISQEEQDALMDELS